MKIMSPEQLSRIAYFSMEIGLESNLYTYSGGLGVLAGDTLRSAADLGLPVAGVTLVYRQGYFRQHLDSQGNQTESPAPWTPGEVLEPMERTGTALNGSFFNTQRMVSQYVTNAYALLDTNNLK